MEKDLVSAEDVGWEGHYVSRKALFSALNDPKQSSFINVKAKIEYNYRL